MVLPDFPLSQMLLQTGIGQDESTNPNQGYHDNGPGLFATATAPGIYNPHIGTSKLPQFAVEIGRSGAPQVVFIFDLGELKY